MNSTFFRSSRNITEKFLQSVVAVDDRLVFESKKAITEDDLDDFENITDEDLQDEYSIPQANPEPQKEIQKGSDLYYQDLSKVCAQNGVNCSAFRPFGNFKDCVDTIALSSQNTDITILDWQMDDDFEGIKDGSLATESISKILEKDIEEKGRLRLIVIYTALDDYDKITEALLLKLPADYGATVEENIIEFNHPEKFLNHCKIYIIGKQTDEESLYDKVVDAFTSITNGLLSNAALSIITNIRDNTHNLLHKFHSDLDSCYVSHVLNLISSPDMREQANDVAFDYAVELISEEIKSNIQTSKNVKDALSVSFLKDWPTHINKDKKDDFFELSIRISGNNLTKKFGSKIMEDLLGVKTEDEVKQLYAAVLEKKQKQLDRIDRVPIDVKTTNAQDQIHEEFSCLEVTRRDRYSNTNSEPTMKQGSVIRCMNNGTYYVCLQPVCDSVRVKEATEFAFIEADVVANNKSFTHVVRADLSEYVRLSIKPGTKKLRTFRFEHDPNGNVIKSRLEEGKYLFNIGLYLEGFSELPESISGKETRKFEWICEFKHHVAQAINNTFAANIARVGLNSYEWLRRMNS